VLEVQELTKDFAGLRAVDRCSFQVERGEIHGLIGPNGSGKTTCFNLITGYLEPTSGRVCFDGEEITARRPYEIVGRGIARTFQMVRVFRRMTVMENLLMAPQQQAGENILLGMLRLPRVQQQEREARERACALLALVGLERAANDYCGNLSYAEQKMVEIIRTLMTEPKLILLDEPASGINPTLVNQILDYIRKLRDEQGKTFLIVEHDMRVIMKLCDRITVLDYGKKIFEGTPSQVARAPIVMGAYLGE
jgi:ABC-type branched-subunit amino acid transport system ATPase component